MAEQKITKDVCNKVGRTFALLFNRAMMYAIDHPFTTQALAQFFNSISDGLHSFSPIVLIMHQDQFFVEDEPLDPRINTGKMLQHFKKTAIQSISFEEGIEEHELVQFATVFFNTGKFATADAMKDACSQQGVVHIKINHVFFKKVTEDDEVVSREFLESTSATGSNVLAEEGDVMGMMAESLLMQELEKSLSLSSIIENPGGASRKIIETDLAAAQSDPSGKGGSGEVIMQNLQSLRSKIDQTAADGGGPALQELAQAVFDMKKDLLGGIATQKAAGVVFQNEQEILSEANEITDQVLMQLIREEYQQGKISVSRLATIVRRLIPEPEEIQRLMPKIKETLLGQGMPLPQFLQLANELKNELQSEGLADVLQKSAGEMGLSGDELIQEISRNPKEAAELIYLASEIRRGTGDEKVMSDLLVDYIEKVGSNIAVEVAEKKGEQGSQQLHKLIASIESALVNRLKTKDIDMDVIHSVAERLNERMDECLTTLKEQWKIRQTAYAGEGKKSTAGVNPGTPQLQGQKAAGPLADETASPPTPAPDGSGPDMREPAEEDQPGEDKIPQLELPKGILNRDSFLFILEKEIARAMRYETPFSVIMLSILRITPSKPIPKESIKKGDIIQKVLPVLYSNLRATDIVGMLDRTKIIVLLPMTIHKKARVAMGRVLKEVHEIEYSVDDTPVAVKLAGTITAFDPDVTPSLGDFITRAETDIFDMMNRLRNVQSIY